MKKQRKFLIGGTVVASLVGYLMLTGMKDTMVYFLTPTELVTIAAEDPGYLANGAKVGGRVVPGSVLYNQETLELRFQVADTAGTATFPVAYQGPLPDTFQEGSDVVVEGTYTAGGTFQATTVLTKCGSRYEAAESDFVT